MTKTCSFKVDYVSHSYNETWEKTSLYCLNCGKREVWMDTDGGDYYQGDSYLCTVCGHGWSTQGVETHEKHEKGNQRLKFLRDPTTHE